MKKILISFVGLITLSILFLRCQNQPYKILKVNYKPIEIQKTKKQADTLIINQTFLGNFKRNYYGNEAPSKLNLKWKTFLGKGKTKVGKIVKEWAGAGWTGQPLLLKINDTLYIIQGAYDHKLKKILAENGKIIDEFEFDDVLKGTGTIWYYKNSPNKDNKIIIIQGSRRGFGFPPTAPVVKSLRAISFKNFKELWAYNSKKLYSYSRDVDASAVIIRDTGYIGLENGLFLVFDPKPENAINKDGILQPPTIQTEPLYFKDDMKTHGTNLVTEGSPTYLNNHIYVESGSGHMFGYNLKTKKIDWILTVGADMDGTPVVTKDSCLIITFEKEYIPGKGGVMKIDPKNPPEESVVWFFPTQDTTYFYWEGGIVGSATVSDIYFEDDDPRSGLTAFTGIDGYFYVVKHDKILNKKVNGPLLKNKYNTPELVFKYRTGPAIATPIIVKNRIVVPTYEGLYLFEFDKNLNFKLLDKKMMDEIEATPFVWDKRVYIACRDGYLYCFGE